MIDWIIENKNWIFDGIGVAIFLTIIGVIFKNKSVAAMKQKAGDGSANFQASGDINIANVSYKISHSNQEKDATPKSEIQSEEVERLNVEIVVKEGDYIDVPLKLTGYRITLKHILTETFELKFGGQAIEGVELHINAGGGLVFGGEYAKPAGVNQWKIPLKSESQEEPYSVYSHFVHEGALSFFRCFVSHINPHSREATLSIYIVRVGNSSRRAQ